MMDLESYKAEFAVAIYSPDIAEGLEFAKTLKKGGFESPVLDDRKTFLQWVGNNTPHLLILIPQGDELKSLVDEIREVSVEILILPVVGQQQLHPTLALASKNLVYDLWLKPLASEVQVLVKVERAIDRLLAQYAQEQNVHAHSIEDDEIYEPFEAPSTKPTSTGKSIFNFYESLVGLSVDLSLIHEREPLIAQFTETLSLALSHTPTLFFRWIPSSSSLVLSATAVLPFAQYRGLGLQFKDWSRSEIKQEMMDPEGLLQLRTLMKKVFSRDHFNAYPLISAGEVLGIFVILDHVTGHLERRYIEGALAALKSNVERIDLLLKNHQLEVFDHLTGLYNRHYLEQCLEREIARSRRTASPLSLVVMELDQASAWRKELGSDGFDDLIRLIGKVLSKTGRANDTLCRVGEGLFVNVLPHTPMVGGLIKAERFRRLLEGTQFKMLQPLANSVVTLSAGVSEYPSTSMDSDSLMRSADDAMASSKKNGGNEVRRALIGDHFQPDFEPVYQHYKPRDRKRASS